MLFFANHPFEGKRVVACPCMTEQFERRFYGSEAIFIYDQDNKTNEPVRGIHNNVLRRWPVFPQRLKDVFVQEFSKERLTNPTSRMIEDGWERIIMQVRDELVICPNCGSETFVNSQISSFLCMNCGKNIDMSNRLKVGNRMIILTKNTPIFLDRDNVPDALVISSPKNNGDLVIKNISNTSWSVETISGKIKTVVPQDIMPVKVGLKINFGALNNENFRGEIINLK